MLKWSIPSLKTIPYSSYKALPRIIPAILITLCRRNAVFSNKTLIWRLHKTIIPAGLIWGNRNTVFLCKNVAKLVPFGKWKTLFFAFFKTQNDAKVHFLEYFEAWLQLWPSANMKTRPLKNKQKFPEHSFLISHKKIA